MLSPFVMRPRRRSNSQRTTKFFRVHHATISGKLLSTPYLHSLVMQPEEIAKKLQPIIPEEIRRLVEAREYSDFETQKLIDMHFIHLARKYLGDYKNKPLLSLPPKSKSNGVFQLGNIVYEKEKWEFGISKKELLQGLAIFGRSGAGKTNCTFLLLEQLLDQGIPFLYLDWKRTARHMLPRMKRKVNLYTLGRSLSPFPFNPFIPPPNLEKESYARQVIDTIASAYTLGDGAKSILQKAIKACYRKMDGWPSVKEILSEVEQMADNERSRKWKISAKRALESIDDSRYLNTDRVTQRELIENLCKTSSILELDALDANAKKFIIPLLSLWLYHYRLIKPDREELRLCVFVEEAHNVFYRKTGTESILEMLMRQCREVGIAMIVIDQHPHLISSAALGNTYTKITLNLSDPSDMNKAASYCLMGEEDKKHLSRLPVGYGIVKLQDRWFSPFLIRLPLMDIQKGSITDEMIEDGYFIRNASDSPSSEPEAHEFSGFPRILSAHSPLNNECLLFLGDVLAHPQDGVKVRYERLGWGSKKGNRIKSILVRQGWLDEEIVNLGNTRMLALRFSRKFKELIGEEATQESIVHEYWKHWYAEHMKRHGFEAILEATRQGGHVDVLAFNEKCLIGIEIETGKSDFLSNLKNGLLSGFTKIFIVATSKKAREKIEKALVREGLLLPLRIRLILAGDRIQL